MKNNIYLFAYLFCFISTYCFAQYDLGQLCQQGEWNKVINTIERSKNPTKVVDTNHLPMCINRSLCDGQYNLFRFFVGLAENGASHAKRVCINQAIMRGNIKTLTFALEHGLDKNKIYKGENFLHGIAKTANKSFELALLFLKDPASSSKALDNATFDLNSISEISGLSPLAEALKHQNYEAAKLFVEVGASLLEAILVKAHRGSPDSLLEPSDEQVLFVDDWLSKNGYRSVRAFIHEGNATPFHKKGVIKFLSHNLPQTKRNTLEKIWREYELLQLETLLLGDSSTSEDGSGSSEILTTSSESDATALSQPKRCICLDVCDDTSAKEYIALGTCNHEICKQCAEATIIHKINDKSTSLTCPAHGCQEPIDLDRLPTLGIRPLTILRLKVRDAERELIEDTDFYHCHKPDCPGGSFETFRFENEGSYHFTCGVCGEIQCNKCGDFHPQIACKDIRLKQNEKFIEKQLAKKKLKKCPKCKVTIEKNEGCDHMTCKKCKYEFYWSTLKKYIK